MCALMDNIIRDDRRQQAYVLSRFFAHVLSIPPVAVSVLSAFFIQHEFRVCSLCAVAAYEDEIHIGKDAEAPIAAELRFELIAEIGNTVIEEFYIRTVR